MIFSEIKDCLEQNPVIAAVHEELWESALSSPAEVIFNLKANLLNVADRISEAHKKGKRVFIHIDLAEGIGKDRTGITFLSNCGADGIISTRSQTIRIAKEAGLMTVQRFFALDSQGVSSIGEMIDFSSPDFIEIMPGIAGKIIERFSNGSPPLIAGGLIETKSEVTQALSFGALAVSTGKEALWYL